MPQVFEVVAPLSVPRKTFFMDVVFVLVLAVARRKEIPKFPACAPHQPRVDTPRQSAKPCGPFYGKNHQIR
jgi:hypothetical protein